MKFNKILLPLSLTTCLSATTTLSCTNKDELVNKLLKLQNVTKVEIYNNVPDYGKTYMVWFKQPIDWNDESVGYFNQRVQINFKGYKKVNVENLNGYELMEANVANGWKSELDKLLNGNAIKIEHRFYGKSLPDGLDNNKTELWKYLNYENALKDFHFINQQLKTIFKGKWELNGGSKGGQIVDIYAMKYPSDFNAYVSFVAPKCFPSSTSTITDEQKLFQDNIYNSIGDNSQLGQETAAKYRKDILTLQYHLLLGMGTISQSDSLLNKFIDDCKEKNYTFVDLAYEHPEYVYLCAVIELPTNIWQITWQQDIEKIQAINALYDTDREACLNQSFEYMLSMIDGKEFARNNPHFAYKYQGIREMGLYNYNFLAFESALKTAFSLTDQQISELIPIESQDKNIMPFNLFFTPEQLASPDFQYQNTIQNELDQWVMQPHDGVNVIQVYGATDPWSCYALPKYDTSNIHFYYDPISPHIARIGSLTEAEQQEIKGLLNQWLK